LRWLPVNRFDERLPNMVASNDRRSPRPLSLLPGLRLRAVRRLFLVTAPRKDQYSGRAVPGGDRSVVAQRQRNDGQRLFRRVDKRRRDDATVFTSPHPSIVRYSPGGCCPGWREGPIPCLRRGVIRSGRDTRVCGCRRMNDVMLSGEPAAPSPTLTFDAPPPMNGQNMCIFLVLPPCDGSVW